MVLNGRVLGNGESRGAARGTRTPDPRITNAMLYRLSYCGTRRRSKRAEIVCSPYLQAASLAMLLTLEHPTCRTTLHRRPRRPVLGSDVDSTSPSCDISATIG